MHVSGESSWLLETDVWLLTLMVSYCGHVSQCVLNPFTQQLKLIFKKLKNRNQGKFWTWAPFIRETKVHWRHRSAAKFWVLDTRSNCFSWCFLYSEAISALYFMSIVSPERCRVPCLVAAVSGTCRVYGSGGGFCHFTMRNTIRYFALKE